MNHLSKMNARETNCDNSSIISDSMESVIETNNNHSTMSDTFNWTINKHDQGLTSKINSRSFTILCDPESENRTIKQIPSSR